MATAHGHGTEREGCNQEMARGCHLWIWGIWKNKAPGGHPAFRLGTLAGWSGLFETANMGRKLGFRGREGVLHGHADLGSPETPGGQAWD